MVSTKKLTDDLINAPQAKVIIGEVIAKMENESKKREQYYALVHENVKAEFINGEIVYQSPVKRIHWKISSRIANALITYVEANQSGEVAVEKAMVSLSRNDYEPDICFFRDEIAVNLPMIKCTFLLLIL